MVLTYGASAAEEDADVLTALQDGRSDDVLPPSGPPAETPSLVGAVVDEVPGFGPAGTGYSDTIEAGTAAATNEGERS